MVQRMIRRRTWLAAAVGLSLLAATGTGTAQDKGKERKAQEKAAKKKAHQDALEALRRGEILPLAKILEISTAQVPGDVIEVEFKGGPVYEVKILTPDGRIREVKLDARTGALIKIEDD
jgi:uncharacterized membrane protein YkoI